jgi:hypothetical protein
MRWPLEEFTRRHQCAVICLAAFEKSEHPDDWRELMRRFMVRRTRSFVERNYAYTECRSCATVLTATLEKCSQCGRAKAIRDQRFLVLEGGDRFHFPKRQPKTLTFSIRDNDPDDQYALLYSDAVVDKIQHLHLPRYGLANYLKPYPTMTSLGFIMLTGNFHYWTSAYSAHKKLLIVICISFLTV